MITDPSQQNAYVPVTTQYGTPVGQVVPNDTSSYDYYNSTLAQLLAQMQGQYLDNSQFYANLDFLKQQQSDLMNRWGQEFGWGQNSDVANYLMQQQAMSGYMQTNPYLTMDGAQYGSGTMGAGGSGYINTLARDIAEWQNQLGQNQLGLDYLSLLGSISGPRDWLQYARTVRGAQGTGLPTWAEALQSGQALPSFGAVYQNGQLSPVYDQFIGQQQGSYYDPYGVQAQAQAQAQNEYNALVQEAANKAGTATTAAAAAQPSWSVPLAQKITQAQWNQLLPSEQQMFLGAVEDAGGYADDYLTQMQKAWGATNRSVTPTTYWS